MQTISRRIRGLWTGLCTRARDQAGASMVEYGLILVTVVLVAVAGFQALGGSAGEMAQSAVDSFPGGTN